MADDDLYKPKDDEPSFLRHFPEKEASFLKKMMMIRELRERGVITDDGKFIVSPRDNPASFGLRFEDDEAMKKEVDQSADQEDIVLTHKKIGKDFYDMSIEEQSEVIDRLLRGMSPNKNVRDSVKKPKGK